MTTPTTHQFTKYQSLYNYYNAQLFQNKLPTCLLILSRKTARVCGHFSKDRWQDKKGNKTHEINLNPVYLARATDQDICQTLVHEMVHLWQYEFGKPSRTGYHNREWATKMESVGLIPSSTGEPGGRKVGQQMSDYPAPDGQFLKVFYAMPKDLLLPFKSAEIVAGVPTVGGQPVPVTDDTPPPPKQYQRNKVKYVCPTCKTKVWGKPALEIICKPCLVDFLKTREETGIEVLEDFVLVAQ